MVNKSGGVRGRSVHFQFWDDQSSPQVALQLANGIIDKHAAGLRRPGRYRNVRRRRTDRAQLAGPVEYCLSPGLQPQKGTFVFSGSRSLDATLLAEARFLNDKNYNRVGVLTATDASGQAGSQAFYDAVPTYRALQIVDEEKFAPTAITLNAEISKIRAAQAASHLHLRDRAGVCHGVARIERCRRRSSGLYVVRQSQQRSAGQYAAFLPKDLYFDGFPFQVGVPMGSAGQRNAYAAFIAAFKAAGVVPTTTSAYAWDPANIVVSAFKQIGPDATAAQIRDYIATYTTSAA